MNQLAFGVTRINGLRVSGVQKDVIERMMDGEVIEIFDRTYSCGGFGEGYKFSDGEEINPQIIKSMFKKGLLSEDFKRRVYCLSI